MDRPTDTQMSSLPSYCNHLLFSGILTLFLYWVSGKISWTACLVSTIYLAAYGLLPPDFFALWGNLAFYHIFLLAFILGAQFYQSFLANITASKALTLAQFRALQPHIWTMYFRMQMLVSVLLVLTYPGGGGKGALFHGSASIQGVFDEDDRSSVLLPLMAMFVFSGTNVLLVAPKTIGFQHKVAAEAVREKIVNGEPVFQSQGDKTNFDAVRDRKAIEKDAEKSPALQAVTKKFLAFHLASYGCNMATIGASFCYAVCIAMRFLS